MFFDIFSELCESKGVSRYKACTDIGLNRAAVAKWKNGAIPTGITLTKLSDYFGVTTDYLLGTEKALTPESERPTDALSDIYFSLAKDLQEAKIDPEDIRNFVQIIIKNMQKGDS